MARVFARLRIHLGLLLVAVSPTAGAERSLSPKLDANQTQSEIVALRREIARHDDLYHRQAAPEISDFDYDQLKRRLGELEKAFPELTRDLPSVARWATTAAEFFRRIVIATGC